MYKILLWVLVLLQTCTPKEQGLLISAEANPEKGYNFPYFLFIPHNMQEHTEVVLLVEPNNSGFATDDFNQHVEKAQRIATKEFYTGNYLACRLKFPLLVPVFPRSRSDWKIYTHAFDRDVALQVNNDLERIDLQLLAMIEDAASRINAMGINTHEQVLMAGFSASGSFVNRFTAIHPEKVMAAAAGGINGLLIIPEETLNDESLDFPLGINDFQELFGKPFNEVAFQNTPQYLFMGELDDNDAIPFEDGYDETERNQVFRLLGKTMMPDRWNTCKAIYEQGNQQTVIRTYPETGHEQPDIIKKDILEFFQSVMDDTPYDHPLGHLSQP